jgi:hypothetical protein
MSKGAPKGHPRYGGRAKGVPNRKTQDLLDKAREMGVDPFEVLLMFAAGDWKSLGYDQDKYITETDRGTIVKWTIEPSVRAKCASDACQYIYPKRKAIELSKDPNSQEQVIMVNAVDLLDRVKALKGKP